MPVPPEGGSSLVGASQVWLGLKNSDDVGIRFDVKAEVFKNGSRIGSGERNSVPGGGSGFDRAWLNVIPLTYSGTVAEGDSVSFVLSVRNACAGSTKNSGAARFWYEGKTATTQVTLPGGAAVPYFLQSSLSLAPTPATATNLFLDFVAGAKCGEYKAVGTWTGTVAAGP